MAVFHVERPTPKHVENSVRGIRKAARLGYSEIDLDMLITKDGRIVGCHWPRPMLQDGFRDPYNVLGYTRSVASMTFAEVHRLKAGRIRPYRIQPIEVLIRECGRRKIGAVLEPKSPHFTQADWDHIAKVADDLGVHIRAYALPKNVPSLAGARAAGINAREIR